MKEFILNKFGLGNWAVTIVILTLILSPFSAITYAQDGVYEEPPQPEVQIEEETVEGIEGCSPGYWKQSQYFSEWPSPYTSDTLFSSVFEDAFPGKTLLQVLELNDGGLDSLGR